MGIFDSYCTLCGVPINGSINKKWLRKFRVLLDNNIVSKPTEDFSGNVSDVVVGNKKYMLSMNYDSMIEKERVCLCIHDDCYKFIEKKFKISLKFSHFPFHLHSKRNYQYFIIYPDFYNSIQKYWSQFFNYEQMVKDKKEYLIESPLKNIKKQNSILHIFNQYKIRSNRNSPLSSASWYKSGDIKIGEDNHFYIISNGKWKKFTNFKKTNIKCDKYDFWKHGKRCKASNVKNPKLYYYRPSKCFKNLLEKQIGYTFRNYAISSIQIKNMSIYATKIEKINI